MPVISLMMPQFVSYVSCDLVVAVISTLTLKDSVKFLLALLLSPQS